MVNRHTGDASNVSTNTNKKATDKERKGANPKDTPKAARDKQLEKQQLVTFLKENCEQKGNSTALLIPSKDGATKKPCSLVSVNARNWVFAEYAKQYGITPLLTVYKEACIDVQSLFFAESGSQGDILDVGKRLKVPGSTNLYVTDVGIGYIRKDKEENETFSSLWEKSETPTVHRVLKVHDTYEGHETQYDMSIGGDRHIVPVDTIKRGTWVSLFHRAVSMSSRSHGLYIDAISALAQEAPLVHGTQTTGIYSLGDEENPQYIFMLPHGKHLTASGNIVSSGEDCSVSLLGDVLTPQALQHWEEATFPETTDTLKQVALLDYMERLTPRGQAMIALCQGIRTCLYDVRDSRYGAAGSLVVVGEPGTGKGVCATINKGIAPYRRKPLADASYQDTAASIERNITGLRSFPVTVDDLKAHDCDTQAGSHDMGLKADRVIRAAHDERPVRNRMTPSMRRQKANPVFTLPCNTWETVPDAPKSMWRRCLLIRIDEGEISVHGQGATIENLETHWEALQRLFIDTISRQLRRIEKNGMKYMVDGFQKISQGYERELRKGVVELWEKNARGQKMPTEWDSICIQGAEILVGAYLVDQVCQTEKYIQTYVKKHLTQWMYEQVLFMSDAHVDEEGYTAIDHAIASILERIASTYVTEGHTWHIEQYTPQFDTQLPQGLVFEDGTEVPDTQWGDIPSSNEMHPLTVAYVHDSVTYITQAFRKLLQKELSLPSDTALSKKLDKAGWLSRENGKQCTHRIKPHGKFIPRVLALRNEKLFPLLGIACKDSPSTQVPDNVKPLSSHGKAPAKSSNPADVDIDALLEFESIS